jgi:hypothetical protein
MSRKHERHLAFSSTYANTNTFNIKIKLKLKYGLHTRLPAVRCACMSKRLFLLFEFIMLLNEPA